MYVDALRIQLNCTGSAVAAIVENVHMEGIISERAEQVRSIEVAVDG